MYAHTPVVYATFAALGATSETHADGWLGLSYPTLDSPLLAQHGVPWCTLFFYLAKNPARQTSLIEV